MRIAHRLARACSAAESAAAKPASAWPPDFARSDERLVYEVVRELQETRTLGQASFERALAALGPELLIELVSVIGFYTAAAMMINAFDAAVNL